MSKTNCVNCGAAKDTSEIRCPFCGTTYLDFTAIDFSKNDPVVCEFVLPHTDRNVLSMLAIPVLGEIRFENRSMLDVTTIGDTQQVFIPSEPEVTADISFKAVTQNNGIIYSLRKAEDVE